jgi:hypothetical protein
MVFPGLAHSAHPPSLTTQVLFSQQAVSPAQHTPGHSEAGSQPCSSYQAPVQSAFTMSSYENPQPLQRQAHPTGTQSSLLSQ